ncbi:MAG: adenylate/guanylate cyclase domain-containing protein [Hyphomicrobiaceae bacterium]
MGTRAAKPATSLALVYRIADWLMRQALEETDIEAVVVGCCERLRAAGVPISRGYFAFTILHPLHQAIGITWQRGQGTTTQGYPHVPGGISDSYRASPHYHMMQHDIDHLRAPLHLQTEELQFPVLTELRNDGYTDYFAFVVGFGDGKRSDRPEGFGMLGSWATDELTGFSDEEIEALLRVEQRLAVACKLAVKQRLMRNVAETYLGKDATSHVLDGQIQRGDGQSIEAAIWYSDMRGSSAMADTMPRQEFIETLNAYFDVTGGAVHDAGGEILSFIGDALLAIFPTDGTKRDATTTCKRAYAAAEDARNRLAILNKARKKDTLVPIEFGTALHLGEVMYGNVGVPERLTFSVFGAAINEVARLETLTKKLKMPILASEAFSTACRHKSRDMGRHHLRGIGRDMTVFAPGRT